MENSYKKLLEKSQKTAVPSHLFEDIQNKVLGYEISRFKTLSAAYSALILLAVIGLVPAISYLINAVSVSGLKDFLSIISIDKEYIITYWREYIVSTIAAVPVFPIIVIGILVEVVYLSLRALISRKNELTSLQSIKI